MQNLPAKLNRRLFTLLFVIAGLCGQSVVCAAEKLSAEQVSQTLIPQLLKLHLKQDTMDGNFVHRMLKQMINELDPSHMFFLKSEADAVIDLPPNQLDELAAQTRAGDFSHYTALVKGFLDKQIGRDADFYANLDKRLPEIDALVKKSKEALAKAADKEKSKDAAAKLDDVLTQLEEIKRALKTGGNDALAAKIDEIKSKIDPMKEEIRAKTQDADKHVQKPGTDKPNLEADADDLDMDVEKGKRNERPGSNDVRQKRILRMIAQLYDADKGYLSATEAFKLSVQTLRDERNKWLAVKTDEEVPKLVLKSFMISLDPHSEYFDAEEDEDFKVKLGRNFGGIGVQIRPCPKGAQIEEIIHSGPAEKSGKFGPGDQIVGVDDVDLAGLPINKIVKKITGEKGTEVKLTVLKNKTSKIEVVTLKRDTIELSEIRVKGKKHDLPEGPVGVIYVNSFYQGVHGDVRDRIKELSKEKPLVGLVLDLRDNHGGYLEEAVGLAGLFIDSGPVVGERDGRGAVDWKNDPYNDAFYKGPLAILTNQSSASASEIVAGTLKDYGRAVIVSSTQTYGKGTVQRVIPLNTLNLPGEVKITTHQYFLAGGDSVQLRGVEPDVVIPGPKLLDEEPFLERATENAIPWNHIPGALDKSTGEVKSWTQWKEKNVAILQDKSKKRADANPDFRDFFDVKKRRAKMDAEAAAKKPQGPDDKPEPPDPKKEEKDPQADEAVKVVEDMIATWPSQNQAAK